MQVLVALYAAILLAAPGNDVAVSAKVEPATVPFHRQTVYTLTVEAPAGSTIDLPTLDAGFFGLPVDGGIEAADLPADPGRMQRAYRITLDPVHPKSHAIPPARVTVAGDTYASNPVTLHVRELTPEEEQRAMAFAPIAQPEDKDAGYAVYIAGTLAALGMIAAGAFIWRRLRKRVPRETVLHTPWDRALNQLAALETQAQERQVADMALCIALADVVREYLEERFAIHAPERTTPELLVEASSTGALAEGHRAVLNRVLRQIDRVKFAQHRMPSDEMVAHIDAVRGLVRETTPAIPAEEAGAAA